MKTRLISTLALFGLAAFGYAQQSSSAGGLKKIAPEKKDKTSLQKSEQTNSGKRDSTKSRVANYKAEGNANASPICAKTSPQLLQTVSSSNANADRGGIEFIGLKLFESPKTPTELGKRSYSANFSKSTTRYVYFEVEVNNLLAGQRDNSISILARYYYPDGKLMGSPELNYTIPSSWSSAVLWQGWGWENSGNWTAGTYTLELWYEGKIFATGSFTIINDVNAESDPYVYSEVFCSVVKPDQSNNYLGKAISAVYIDRAGSYVWVVADNFPDNLMTGGFHMDVYKKDGSEYLFYETRDYDIDAFNYTTAFFQYTFYKPGDYLLKVYSKENKFINSTILSVYYYNN